ncbi:MAG: metallophosphoesterase, partial [Ruminococcus sp.]|nr:metallophosphoesterase [Ruminococcus sp.]
MKFIHIADIHLGVAPEAGKLYSEKRPKEIWDTFKSILEICEEEKTDLLLIAGDLFHRQPLLRELKEVDYLFSRLTHTKVVLIAGNHDYIRKDSYYRTFSWNENVFTLFNNEIGTVVFPELETAVYGLSYHEKEIKESLYDGLQPKKL